MLSWISANCECVKPGLEYSNFKIGQSSSLEEPSHTSSVTFLNRSEIFVNILEHSGAQQNAYKPGFPHVFLSLLHRLRESQ